MNQAILLGNLASDTNLRMSEKSGKAVCTFRIAVNTGWGENQQTSFLHIVTFGKLAENCNKWLEKGRKVLVRGRIVTDSYTGQDGQKRYTTDIWADEVEFLSRGESSGAPKADAPAVQSAPEEDDPMTGFAQMGPDEVPF